MFVLKVLWLGLFGSKFVLSEITGQIKIANPRWHGASETDSLSSQENLLFCLGKQNDGIWTTFGCAELQANDAAIPIEAHDAFSHVIIRDPSNLRTENVDFAEIPLMFPNDRVRHLLETEKGFQFQISLECNDHFFGPRCHVQCDPSKLGRRFACHALTGEITCSSGWIGPDCSENIFIDKKAAFQFLSRPKRSEDREDCSKRKCTTEELRNDFLLHGSESSDDEQTNHLGGEGSSDCDAEHCDKNGTLLCLRLNGEKHACRCKTGYKGDRCEVIDLCHFEPCHNGGECEDGEEGIVCACPNGFAGTFCEEKVQTCEENPCENNGICESDASGFRCICIEGFSGPTCDFNINDCPEDACSGRGECHDGVNAYECACEEGYYGNDCQIVDPCSRTPCENGGVCRSYSDDFFQCDCPEEFEGSTCSEKGEDPCSGDPCNGNGECAAIFEEQDDEEFSEKRIVKCFCNNGFVGEYCETKVSPCDANVPCPDNATCIAYDSEFVCKCPHGYEGEHCERRCDNCEESNEMRCKSNPCENNARCLVVEGKMTCLCQPGFTGPYCEVAINFCDEISCAHGECFSMTNGYECVCEHGYRGDRCDEDINECEEQHHLCKNDGECRNTEGSYMCNCVKGYEGEHCDHKVDACSSYPCMNGGSCYPDGMGSFQCFCKIGFVGMTCEFMVDYCEDKPCKNGGKCEVLSLENQEIKCTCTERFYGDTCDEEIPICSMKREQADGTFQIVERTDCGYHGKCVPIDENNFECECSDGYQGKLCDEKILPFQCKEPYCVCDSDIGAKCAHRIYGEGKCGKEDCLAQNCTEPTNLVCEYESKCSRTRIFPRINLNITDHSCDIVELFFDRNRLPKETTAGQVCQEMRNLSEILETDAALLICSVQERTKDDIKLIVSLGTTGQQGEGTPHHIGEILFNVLRTIINSRKTEGNNGSALFAIENATFDGKTIFPQAEQTSSFPNSADDSTRSPVDRTASSKELYMIIPVAVVGSSLVIVLLIVLVIWIRKIERTPTPTPAMSGPDNNNIQHDSVTWSKSSNGKSFENSISFGVENTCFTSEENCHTKSQGMQNESLSPDESDKTHGVTTFVPRNRGLYSESGSSITKR